MSLMNQSPKAWRLVNTKHQSINLVFLFRNNVSEQELDRLPLNKIMMSVITVIIFMMVWYSSFPE